MAGKQGKYELFERVWDCRKSSGSRKKISIIGNRSGFGVQGSGFSDSNLGTERLGRG